MSKGGESGNDTTAPMKSAKKSVAPSGSSGKLLGVRAGNPAFKAGPDHIVQIGKKSAIPGHRILLLKKKK